MSLYSVEQLHHALRHWIFERYECTTRKRVVWDLMEQVEQFVPADFETLQDMRRLLSLAAEPQERDEAEDRHERSLFLDFLIGGDPTRWCYLPRLPHFRVLSSRECGHLRHEFESRWGQWYAGYCNQPHGDNRTLDVRRISPVEAERMQELLIGVVGELMQGPFLYELREHGPSYERELGWTEFRSPSETFWTTLDFDWMIYCSHESTITFAGRSLLKRLEPSLAAFLTAEPIDDE